MPERAGTAADAIVGVVPRLVFEPASVAEAAEAVARCARDRLALGFIGGGTDLGLGNAPLALDAVLRTTGLSRVVEYAPADQIVVVEAGATLAGLEPELAAHGQWLALDPPLPERATVGGVVAANAFGPRRARYGSARDLILGVTLVRADGVEARLGGKVVKNVAGFDLPRLMVGALGSLGLLSTVTFRLHPRPEAAATVILPAVNATQASSLAAAWRQAQLEPTSAAALVVSDQLDLGVRFEGFAPGVAAQAGRLLELGQRDGVRGDRLGEAEAAVFWARHDAARTLGPLRVKMAAPASRFPEVARGVLPLVLGEVSPGAAVWYPTLGLGFAGGQPPPGATAAGSIAEARRAAAALGGSLVLCDAPHDLRNAVDVWGDPPPSYALMQRLKDRLDPDWRLNRGRFVGGL